MSDWDKFERAEAERSRMRGQWGRAGEENLGTYAWRNGIRPGFMGGMGPGIPAPGAGVDADPQIVQEMRARLLAQRAGQKVAPLEGAEQELVPSDDPNDTLREVAKLLGEDVPALPEDVAQVADVGASEANDPPRIPVAVQARENATTGQPGPKAHGRLEQRACEVCGKPFEVNHRNRKQRTCSRKCGAAQRQSQRAEIEPSAEIGDSAPNVTNSADDTAEIARYTVLARLVDGTAVACAHGMTLAEVDEFSKKLKRGGFHPKGGFELKPGTFTVELKEES